MFLVTMDTGHFDFTAIGATEQEARDRMAEAFDMHRRDCGLVPWGRYRDIPLDEYYGMRVIAMPATIGHLPLMVVAWCDSEPLAKLDGGGNLIHA